MFIKLWNALPWHPHCIPSAFSIWALPGPRVGGVHSALLTGLFWSQWIARSQPVGSCLMSQPIHPSWGYLIYPSAWMRPCPGLFIRWTVWRLWFTYACECFNFIPFSTINRRYLHHEPVCLYSLMVFTAISLPLITELQGVWCRIDFHIYSFHSWIPWSECSWFGLHTFSAKTIVLFLFLSLNMFAYAYKWFPITVWVRHWWGSLASQLHPAKTTSPVLFWEILYVNYKISGGRHFSSEMMCTVTCSWRHTLSSRM